jgi:hypothetical protein
MAFASNPLIHNPGRGSENSAEANASYGAFDASSVPTIEAVIVVIAGLLLVWQKKAGFRFVVAAGRS